MSRIEINADGRHVIVDHEGELSHLIEKALATWQATEKERRPRGFAITDAQAGPRPGHCRGRFPRCTPLLCVCEPSLPPSEDRRERRAELGYQGYP